MTGVSALFWFMLVCDLLIPLMMVLFGRIFIKHPPRSVDASYGYRTTMSMKNADTWAFAHQHSGRIWFYGGLLLTLFSVVTMVIASRFEAETYATIGGVLCVVQLIVLIGSIIPTERALKRTFDKEGHRK